MIDLDEVFLNILKIFLVELKCILIYCINRITPGHRKNPGHLMRLKKRDKNRKNLNSKIDSNQKFARNKQLGYQKIA